MADIKGGVNLAALSDSMIFMSAASDNVDSYFSSIQASMKRVEDEVQKMDNETKVWFEELMAPVKKTLALTKEKMDKMKPALKQLYETALEVQERAKAGLGAAQSSAETISGKLN